MSESALEKVLAKLEAAEDNTELLTEIRDELRQINGRETATQEQKDLEQKYPPLRAKRLGLNAYETPQG